MQKEKEAINMEVNGMISKLTGNADKLGALLGAFGGSANGINDIISTVQNAFAGKVHLPNWAVMQTWLSSPYLQQAILTYIMGEVIDQVDPPMIGKYGSAIKKGAIGYAAASAAVHLGWSMTHADLGSNPTNPRANAGYSRGYRVNVTPSMKSVYQ